MLTWCGNTFFDEECQKELEHKVLLLLEGPLGNKSEYAQEKAIKAFSEGLGYLETLLLMKKNIHPHDLMNHNHIVLNPNLRNKCLEELDDVKKSILSEIDRQYRHFLIFL